jgi:protein N-lysine methyltransferase METTL21A
MASPHRSPSPESPDYSTGEDLTPLPEYKAATITVLDLDGLLAEPLKLHEDLKDGCGGQLWPAGIVLAKHMLRYHRDKLEKARMSVSKSQPPLDSWSLGQPITTSSLHITWWHSWLYHSADRLELGSGGGLVGLAVARGSKIDTPMLLTDQLEMEELMRRNTALNGLQDKVGSMILNW